MITIQLHCIQFVLNHVLCDCNDVMRKKRERECSPTVTDHAKEIRTSEENPSSSVIQVYGHSLQHYDL